MRFEYELGDSKIKENLMRLINDYEKRFSKFNCGFTKIGMFNVSEINRTVEFSIPSLEFMGSKNRYFGYEIYFNTIDEIVHYKITLPNNVYGSTEDESDLDEMLHNFESLQSCMLLYQNFVDQVYSLFDL